VTEMTPQNDFAMPRSAPQTGVPRRYTVGALLVITTLYAIVFGLLRTVDAEPPAFVGVALYLTAIGAAQMLLFRGEKPREASILVGSAVPLLIGIFVILSVGNRGGGPGTGDPIPLLMTALPVLGAIVGYLLGCTVAGVFLVIERFRQWQRRREAERPEES
jgi:hypothetical protein